MQQGKKKNWKIKVKVNGFSLLKMDNELCKRMGKAISIS